MFIVWDKKNKEYVKEFLIMPDGGVIRGNEVWDKLMQSNYNDYEIKLKTDEGTVDINKLMLSVDNLLKKIG